MIDQSFRTRYRERGLQMLRHHRGAVIVPCHSAAERACAGLLLDLLGGCVQPLTIAELVVCRDFLAGELLLSTIERAYDVDLVRVCRYREMLDEVAGERIDARTKGAGQVER